MWHHGVCLIAQSMIRVDAGMDSMCFSHVIGAGGAWLRMTTDDHVDPGGRVRHHAPCATQVVLAWW